MRIKPNKPKAIERNRSAFISAGKVIERVNMVNQDEDLIKLHLQGKNERLECSATLFVKLKP